MNESDEEAVEFLDQAITANRVIVGKILKKELQWCSDSKERMGLMKAVMRATQDIRRMIRLKRTILKESNSEEKN